jgi:hypothetical protein
MGYAIRHTGREAALHSPGLEGGSSGCSHELVVLVARHHSRSSAGRGRRLHSSRYSTYWSVKMYPRMRFQGGAGIM